MVASIGAVAAPAQCVAYFERDYYYAKDSPHHRDSSIWRGRGAEDLGLSGPVDPEVLRSVLEGVVPDGSGQRLGKRGKEGVIHPRPGRDGGAHRGSRGDRCGQGCEHRGGEVERSAASG